MALDFGLAETTQRSYPVISSRIITIVRPIYIVICYNTYMSEQISYLFINGLGGGQPKWHERLAIWRWQKSGTKLHHYQANWHDGQSFESMLEEVTTEVDELLESTGKIALIGSSAGGSLALNTFFRSKDRNVSAVVAHGRLAKGDYPDEHRKSLQSSAFHRDNPSQSFFDSVTFAENEVIPNLTDDDKQRLIILLQLTDRVVPLETMTIEGVQTHKSITFGHSGGFLAHLLADKSIIEDFAEQSLN